MTVTGIDVSDYQGAGFSTKGLSFVIVKATEGRSYVNPKQSAQAKRARDAGLVVGFYHFIWPGNIEAQAKYFVEKCASVEGDLLALDWETTTDGTRASGAEKDQFLKAVKRLRPQHRVLLYCNRDFWVNVDTTSYAGDGLWIADYNGRPGRPGIQAEWLIHQHTSTPVDTNVAEFVSAAAMRTWARVLLDDEPAAPPAKPKPPAKPAVPRFPGASHFRLGHSDPAVTQLDQQLVRHGFTHHDDGNGYQPGPRFTEYTRLNVADFQRSRTELRGDPDGYPGPLTWQLLFS